MTDQQDLETASGRGLSFEHACLRAVFEAVETGLLIVDGAGLVTACNSEAIRLFGPPERIVGVSLPELLVAGATEHVVRPVLDRDWLNHVMVQHRWQLEAVQFRPKGMPSFPASCTIVPFDARPGDPDGATRNGAVILIADATVNLARRAALEWEVTHDPLTALRNHAFLTDRLHHALSLAEHSALWPAVLYLDLDRFKSVNDQLGHRTGDRLLIEAARRIERSVRSIDTVARLDGDEFAVLFESLERQDIADQMAAKILQEMQEPFDFSGEQVTVSASIGIARADDSTGDAEHVIDHADLAMYRAKEAGRNRIETFDGATRSQSRRRVDIERALRLALDNDDLSVDYQPIFNTEHGALVAFEALVRWHHTDLGTIAPMEFIPLAEQTGLIAAVGDRVLDIACRDAASWRDTAHYAIGLHVNVSGRQLGASNFVSYLGRVTRHHHLDPTTLTLDVAESVLLENPERTATRFMALRELGVRITIADFGVGYSSIASLRRFPLDVLKVDRQFVAGIAQSPEGQRVLEEIVLTAGLDYEVIAEGVEQPEELVSLRELGFQFAQGYLLAAPMPPAEALLLAAASAYEP